jgi:hypothetical protein
VYEEASDILVNRLNKMWVQQLLVAPIEVVNSDYWGTINGSYFIRIEVTELLQHQKSIPNPVNNVSSSGMNDAASFL